MKLIIMDRDGVINQESDEFIKSPEEWHPIPGSLEAISRLSNNGYAVVVATNQSGIGRGLFDSDTLNKIHSKMMNAVQEKGGTIDGIFFCPHSPKDGCLCRKPKPGLLMDIAKRFRVDLSEVIIVGDSMRDMESAFTVKASPYLVLTGNGRATAEEHRDALVNVPRFENLQVLVEHLLDDRETSS